MKKWIIPILSMMVFFGSVSIYAATADTEGKSVLFKDVQDNHWARTQIVQAAQNNYVSGYPDGSFQPSKPVTRAEFIKMVVDALKLPHSQGATPWYQPYVAAAFEMELLDNTDSTEYKKPISRVEIMRIVSRGLAREERYTAYFDAFDGLYNGDLPFTDYRDFQQNDLPYIALAFGAEIVNGYPDGTMGLKKTATRAEAVVMIENLLAVRIKDPATNLRLQELKEVSGTGMNVTSVSNLIPLVDLSKDKIVVETKKYTAKLKRLYVVPIEGSKVSLYEKKFLWDRNDMPIRFSQNLRGYVITVLDVTYKVDGDHQNLGNNTYLSPQVPFTYQIPQQKFGHLTSFPSKVLTVKKGKTVEFALYGFYRNDQPFLSLQSNTSSNGGFYDILRNLDAGK
ncbi:S-layer homology domain-containing protein [Cohnella sp.]|uniref:S-layer homology domain-containing protein n=1 Tax=Cohnella sp. TaxID=1883426 RepID=UPI003569CBED